MEGRHQLVVGVERHLTHARVEAPRLVDVDPALRRQHDERRLGRVADDLAVANRCVVRERHRQQERLERSVRLARDAKDPALGRVALAVDREAAAGDDELPRRHLVERQRPGLVRADRRRRAERLHRPQPLHDRPLGRERLRSQREHGRDDRGKAGRDRRDREADPDDEELVEVVPVNQPENDDERQRGARHDREQDGQLVELARERRLLLLDLAQHPGDPADLGCHPRCRDDHLAPTPCHGRVHVGHVDPVPERYLATGHRFDCLQDRSALARQRGLLDLQRRGHEQATVRRDLVARLEDDDVARHELLGGDVHTLAVTPGMSPDDEHLLERGDALGRLALLVQAEDRVEHGQAEDHEAGGELLQGDDADDRGAEQDELHQVAVLAQERLPAGLLPRLRRACSGRPAHGAARPPPPRARAAGRRRAARTPPPPSDRAIPSARVGRPASPPRPSRRSQKLRPARRRRLARARHGLESSGRAQANHGCLLAV